MQQATSNASYTGSSTTPPTPPTPTRMVDTIESLQKAALRLGSLSDRSARAIGSLVGGWPQEADPQPNESGSDLASVLRGIDTHIHRKISQCESAIEMLETRALRPEVLAAEAKSAAYR